MSARCFSFMGFPGWAEGWVLDTERQDQSGRILPKSVVPRQADTPGQTKFLDPLPFFRGRMPQDRRPRIFRFTGGAVRGDAGVRQERDWCLIEAGEYLA